ncbi:MAG: DUF4321 domain-containing protein [Chitinophagales bacterium]
MSAQGGYRTSRYGWQVLIIVLIVGALLGGWIGEALGQFIPVLRTIGRSYPVGIPELDINLRVIRIVFGFTLNLNLFSLLGLIAGFFVYRKL